MRKSLVFVAVAMLTGLLLAATVLREPIAYAAQGVDAIIVGPLDRQGNVKVHEQGTANVNVTNSSVTVAPERATNGRTFSLIEPAGGSDTEFLGPINVSFISLTSMQGNGFVDFRNGVTSVVLRYETDGGDLVLPFAQTVELDRITLNCEPSSPAQCEARLNVVGG